MKFNITPSHSLFSPLNKYSVFSEWKNPVTKKNSSLCDWQNVCVIPKAYNRQKKDLLGVKRRVRERKRVKKFMKKFLYLEFQIPRFYSNNNHIAIDVERERTKENLIY